MRERGGDGRWPQGRGERRDVKNTMKGKGWRAGGKVRQGTAIGADVGEGRGRGRDAGDYLYEGIGLSRGIGLKSGIGREAGEDPHG